MFLMRQLRTDRLSIYRSGRGRLCAPVLPPRSYLQPLRVAGYVPGHAAEPLAVTVHRSAGAGALGRAGLAEHPGRQEERHRSQQQQQPGRTGAQSSHHHCGKSERGAGGTR